MHQNVALSFNGICICWIERQVARESLNNGVALKLVPPIVTVVAIAPLVGVTSLIATPVSGPGRSIAVMFPTASYR